MLDLCDAAPFEGKELKQQPPCIEEAGSRTNRQNISGPPVQPPARFEGCRLPLRCINAKWDIGMRGRKLRINLYEATRLNVWRCCWATLLALYLTRSSGACTRVGRNFLRIHGDLYILHEYHPCINMGINGGTLGRKQPRGNGNSELGAKLS